jgi:cytochrome c1
MLIAGVVPNKPDSLAQFVREASSISSQTAMPRMPLNEQQARDVAAFLYTLR